MDLVSLIDAIRNATATELTLRNEANREWASGIKDGPMMAAHKASITRIIELSVSLVTMGNPKA